MNPLERQLQLGRELFEINANAWRKLAEFDSETLRKYVEFNQNFAQQLPEVKDFSGFVELQRTYGETLWQNAQDVLKTRGEIVRDAVEVAGGAVRGAFSADDSATPDAQDAAQDEAVQDEKVQQAETSQAA
ncbi:MAG: phasin family protein [Gammaproteobacteria bacterium]|nr:phasin family protein [Gammaproteobacteria bacterium]